jgi:hypothetical protein
MWCFLLVRGSLRRASHLGSAIQLCEKLPITITQPLNTGRDSLEFCLNSAWSLPISA